METDAVQSNTVCCKSLNDDRDINSNIGVEKCRQWLKCNLNDNNLSSCDSLSYCSNADSNFTTDGMRDDNVLVATDVSMEDKVIVESNANLNWKIFTNNEPNHYKNIQIYKSQNVHIGNVTHIHGPVYINEFAPTLNQTIVVNPSPRVFPVVLRRTWLAQPPLDLDDVKYIDQPAKFVIICHSASEESDTQTGNNLLVRLIQQFHIESLNWNDIGYNFLAGADGSIYEGRGWNVIGAHTLGYNTHSIGLCFIGCYMRKLPPASVMKTVQEFIKYGVEIGAIAEDYTLLGHCQCRSSANPGAKLFEEIKTWDRWDGSISVDNPSPWAIL